MGESCLQNSIFLWVSLIIIQFITKYESKSNDFCKKISDM